ncbi:putative reverse transcriptase/RNA-dependent DNA polymerase [Citrus sinensis]|uniref:Reverse transcriptase/RNA-dependent DNA polymerase n=1 Tax=Citrus sinensis TaxID=2711 RepID=A0ACB8IGG2_CITSI|nr:putative reverse transcriptase/RNA-dependent DNA polymerase [Citrus sinensis]
MSVFRLPKGLCDDIQKSIAKFWWGSREDRYGIHWSRWDKMSQAKSRGGLGFRDLTSFNQALVAKQAWRLLQLPNSLLARVLQAKYYKYSSLLNATAGSNPSFIWKSILWGRQVIDKGARWRVGNGRKIRTYKDNWLPRPDTFKPISPQKLPAKTMVAELIDEENQWIVSKLEQNFLPQDIEAILQIPLPRTKKEDEVLWHYDKRGEYSVKSGYQIAFRLKFQDMTSSSGSCSRQWNVLWSLELPEKIKIFMWRAIKNILPTTENLWKRKCLPEPTCPRCHKSVETISHALFECKAARKTWNLAPSTFELQNVPGQDIFSYAQNLCSNSRRNKAELMIMYCWAIWFARNKLIFERKKIEPMVSAAKAESVLEAYQRVRKTGTLHIRNTREESQQRWSPPPTNVLKLNVDATTNSKDQKVGLGAVLRDSNGRVVAAGIKQASFRKDVSFAEAEAIQWGLQIAKEAAAASLIVETDCKDMAELLNNTKGSRSEIFWIISEIQTQKREFQRIHFNFVPRFCNAHAHFLAKHALRKDTTAVWLDILPVEVQNVFDCVV